MADDAKSDSKGGFKAIMGRTTSTTSGDAGTPRVKSTPGLDDLSLIEQ
jgi:hypothetical protein